jgi:hypothetical protein
MTMPGAPGSLEQFFWYSTIALHAVLVWRMWRCRLAGRYPAIFILLAMQLARSLWVTQYIATPQLFRYHANQYSFSIVFTEPILILARAVAVFELTAAALQSYRGLSVLSRATLAAGLVASVTLSLLVHSAEFTFSGEPFRFLRVIYLLETTVYSALAVFLFLLALFVLYHPAPIRKNVLAHGIGFSVYMLSSAAAVWLRNQDAAQWTRAASTMRLGITLLGLAAWAWLLSPRGEEESVEVHIPLSEETGQRVLARLDALNSALERK